MQDIIGRVDRQSQYTNEAYADTREADLTKLDLSLSHGIVPFELEIQHRFAGHIVDHTATQDKYVAVDKPLARRLSVCAC